MHTSFPLNCMVILSVLLILNTNAQIIRDPMDRYSYFPDGNYHFFSLKNGKYVTSQNYCNDPLIANRDAHSGWQTFSLSHILHNLYTVKSCGGFDLKISDTQEIVPAVSGNAQTFYINFFQKNSCGNYIVSIRTYSTSKYLSVREDDRLRATSDQFQMWEMFEIIPATN